MGFLEVGVPMEWEDSAKYHATADYVREHGVVQFLNTWNSLKSRSNDQLLWGDEMEYHLYTETEDGLKLSLKSANFIKTLESEDSTKGWTDATWHPEYGSWMIEATPARPYGGYARELLDVERNMRYRRWRIESVLPENTHLLSMGSWLRMGCEGFLEDDVSKSNSVSQSMFLPDAIINPHPRFATLTRNIRLRRGQKVRIGVPLFMDENTSNPKKFKVTSSCNTGIEQVGEIYMDAMGFGMGCCCLQVTFQARDLEESRLLYDQLSVLCPIFLALTASTPVLKGLLADTDVRWSTIAQSVDCRTPVEKGCSETPITLKGATKPQRGEYPIRKSRYDSVDLYMSTSSHFKDSYNDVDTEIDSKTFEKLTNAGVDVKLAKHIGHLFVRDPLVVFSDRVEVDDSKTTEHFENIQSTNWQTMRWKPPPNADTTEMGWRVEFRPMEVQFTDFENAAFTVVIILIARVVLFFDLNLYVPISLVDENMARAHARDAVLTQKFHFRKNMVPLAAQCGAVTEEGEPEDACGEYTLGEILIGDGDNEFPGLIPLIWAYLDIIGVDAVVREKLEEYLTFVAKRADGELSTPSAWMREFVQKHPDYKKDSVISKKIEKDMVSTIQAITHGERHEPKLLGKRRVEPYSAKKDGPAASPATMARKLPPKPSSLRLRGASFQSDVTNPSAQYSCDIVRTLVQRYSDPSRLRASKYVIKNGFASTPSFLDDAAAAAKRRKA